MEAFQFQMKPLCKDTWWIDGDGCTSYVLKGQDAALMVDTGYGEFDVRAFAEAELGFSISACINTHGHFDHAGGNGCFEHAYMSRGAEQEAKTPYPSFGDRPFKLDYPIVYVEDGQLIDLGGRVLVIFEIASHSPGDIAILDRRERILFTGDAIGRYVPLFYQQDDPQPTIEAYAKHLERLLARRAEYDYVAGGHGEGLVDAGVVEACYQNAKHIMAGNEGSPMQPMEIDPGKPKFAKGPRYGDLIIHLPEEKRESTWDGTTIAYDRRYVYDRG